jgi:ring-1,2-phenylacetyl-CoA epoxidase subunit PaaD
MVNTQYTKEEILSLLSVIPDPEIPVVNIREMGMLRDVVINEDTYEIIITPTYSGCPAMGMIEHDIKELLIEKGVRNSKITLVYSPAWTTDWMDETAKEKMRNYGIAPPLHSSCSNLFGAEKHLKCPHCGATDTELISQFGSTACKALYRCTTCKEPFEYFKCH